MASYQNTSEYYCGMTVNTYPQHCPNPNVYCNQIPTNFQTHAVAYSPENYNQAVYPGALARGSFYNPMRGQIIYNNSNVYGHTPQYNTFQYSSLAPEPVPYPVCHQEPKRHNNNQYMAKRPSAQISILPSSKRTFKAQIKRKRKRTIYTAKQIEALEDFFKTQHHINREQRLEIGNQLQLNDKAVKVWFQNCHLKGKRLQDEDSEEQEERSNTNLEEERSSSVIARLDSIESLINEKTDENGFVTLDDEVMNNLVNVIDNFLTKNSEDIPAEDIVESESSLVCEPISPASTSDNSEEDVSVNWRPSDPSESLQILYDLQSMSITCD